MPNTYDSIELYDLTEEGCRCRFTIKEVVSEGKVEFLEPRNWILVARELKSKYHCPITVIFGENHIPQQITFP